MQYAQRNVVLAGELHRTDLQHLGTEAGHFQHLFKGDLVQTLGHGHHTRVSGIDTVHIGVDLAFIGLQRRCQCHAGGVRTATPEGSDVALLVHTLEACYNYHATGLQIRTDFLIVDLQNARLGMRAVGQDAHLTASVGHRWHTALVQRHGQQGDGHLLTGGHDHIQLTRERLLITTDCLGQIDQAIGLAAHGRQHHHQVVAGIAEFLNLVGHLLDSFDRADRGASKFLYDQSHF